MISFIMRVFRLKGYKEPRWRTKIKRSYHYSVASFTSSEFKEFLASDPRSRPARLLVSGIEGIKSITEKLDFGKQFFDKWTGYNFHSGRFNQTPLIWNGKALEWVQCLHQEECWDILKKWREWDMEESDAMREAEITASEYLKKLGEEK